MEQESIQIGYGSKDFLHFDRPLYQKNYSETHMGTYNIFFQYKKNGVKRIIKIQIKENQSSSIQNLKQKAASFLKKLKIIDNTDENYMLRLSKKNGEIKDLPKINQEIPIKYTESLNFCLIQNSKIQKQFWNILLDLFCL